MLILTVDGQPFVQCVALDDESNPEYIERYVRAVRESLDPTMTVRWALVDVSRVSEYGPDHIAAMLTEQGQAEGGVTDLSQRWTTIPGRRRKAWGIFDATGLLKRVEVGDSALLEIADDEHVRPIDLDDNPWWPTRRGESRSGWGIFSRSGTLKRMETGEDALLEMSEDEYARRVEVRDNRPSVPGGPT